MIYLKHFKKLGLNPTRCSRGVLAAEGLGAARERRETERERGEPKEQEAATGE